MKLTTKLADICHDLTPLPMKNAVFWNLIDMDVVDDILKVEALRWFRNASIWIPNYTISHPRSP
jgi:hypothetical protein